MVEPEGVGAGSTVERCMTTPTLELEQAHGLEVELALAGRGPSPRGVIARVDVGGVSTAVSVTGVRSKADFLARVRDTDLPGAESQYVFLWLPDSAEWIAVSEWRAAMALLPFGEEQVLLALSSDGQPPPTRAWHGQLGHLGHLGIQNLQAVGAVGLDVPKRALAAIQQALEDSDFEFDEEDALLAGADADAADDDRVLLLAPAPAVTPNPLQLRGLKRLGVAGAPLLLFGASIVAFNSGNSHTGYGVQRTVPLNLLMAGCVGLFLSHAWALLLDWLLPDVARSALLHRLRRWLRASCALWLVLWLIIAGIDMAANLESDKRDCRQRHLEFGHPTRAEDCRATPILFGYFFAALGTAASLPALAEDRATQPAAGRTRVLAGCSERALHTPRRRAAHGLTLAVLLLAVGLMAGVDLWNVGSVAYWAAILALLFEALLSAVVLGRASLCDLCVALHLPPRGAWIVVLVVEALLALTLLVNGAGGALGLGHWENTRRACNRTNHYSSCDPKALGARTASVGLWLVALAGVLIGGLAVARTAKAARGVVPPSPVSPPSPPPTPAGTPPSSPGAPVEPSPRRTAAVAVEV